jgi:hypothetical protein
MPNLIELQRAIYTHFADAVDAVSRIDDLAMQ